MLDLSYFQNKNSNVQGFFNGGTWQTWIKPRGAKIVNIMCVGSGAGGGGGFQSATAPRGGGGSGGNGAISRLTINAALLPDRLYVLPGVGGNGGLGGAPATAGSLGQNSFVTLTPNTASPSSILLRSGNSVSIGGQPGISSSGGAVGGGETLNVIANNIFANLGNFTFQAGNNGGGAGGTASGGGSGASNFMVGGSGGGGTGGLGGSSLASGVFPGYPSAPVNTNGASNLIFYKPTLILYGGGGGGGASSGNGGNGGNGAPGCGGGGGGASATTGVNAGNGGRGGDGFIIITTNF